jgi:hypothetical protein
MRMKYGIQNNKTKGFHKVAPMPYLDVLHDEPILKVKNDSDIYMKDMKNVFPKKLWFRLGIRSASQHTLAQTVMRVESRKIRQFGEALTTEFYLCLLRDGFITLSDIENIIDSKIMTNDIKAFYRWVYTHIEINKDIKP